MARKGCGPYNLGAPKAMAKQVIGPRTEEETSAGRPRITGPIITKTEEYVQNQDAKQKAAKASLVSLTDRDGREFNQIEYKGRTFNTPTREEYKKLKKMQLEGKFDNYKDYDEFNKKNSYNQAANLHMVTDTKTGEKKPKQVFSRGQAQIGSSGGGANTQEGARRLNQRGQMVVRGEAERFVSDPNSRNPSSFRDYNAAQEVRSRFLTDSIKSDHSAMDYVRRQKAKIDAYEGRLPYQSSPNNKVKSAAYKMKGFGSKTYK